MLEEGPVDREGCGLAEFSGQTRLASSCLGEACEDEDLLVLAGGGRHGWEN